MRPNRTRAWLVAPSLLVAMTSTGCQLVADVDRQDLAGETDSDFDGGTGDAGGDGDASQDADGADGDVACATPSDCPGSDDECRQRTCDDGVCGTSFTAEGTPITAQDAGDCAQIVCDGNGGTKTITDDEDLPDDDNPCTDDVCEDGSPEHPPVGAGAPCGSGLSCDGAGACVGCVAPTDCPGSDDDCRTRTCDEGVCGFDFAPDGTPVSAQTSGDCKKEVCDGAGQVKEVDDDDDVPDDGNECTVDGCSGGEPDHSNVAPGTACNQDGGTLCDGVGSCVECVTAATCPGTDTECQTRTCDDGVCGFAFAPQGQVVSSQTPGDCRQVVCDGAGATVTVDSETDVPVDGNPCTLDSCNGNVPSNLPVDLGVTCGADLICDGAGNCVGCVADADCPGGDECKTPRCNAGTCGFEFAPEGTEVSAQTANDCKKNVCDGAGNTIAENDDTDVPLDDGDPCTVAVCAEGVGHHVPGNDGAACSDGDACTQIDSCQNGVCVGALPITCFPSGECHLAGVCDPATGQCSDPIAENGTACNDGNACTQTDTCSDGVCFGSNPVICQAQDQCHTAGTCNHLTGLCSNPVAQEGTTCNENGGTSCDGAGNCVAAAAVTATTPADGSSAKASTSISISFATAMAPATLIAQTTAGPCSGSVQVSKDGFASCIAFATAAPEMSGDDKVATFVPAPGLLVNRTYAIRVTTEARTASDVPLAEAFVTPVGFTTTSPNLCDGSLVISQVFASGGAAAAYKHDFIELHNRGATQINLAGLSLQYTSATGTAWGSNKVNLSGTIPPGGYFLIQLAGALDGTALPTPDFAWGQDIGVNGKIALVEGTTALAATACPDPTRTIDFIGTGSANCSEGPTAVATLSATASAQRRQNGCSDVNANRDDFVVDAPAPRNSSTPAKVCACTVWNESDDAREVAVCAVNPSATSAQAGAPTVALLGSIVHTGITEDDGAHPDVRAQLGYGPATANPQYESSWTWRSASYMVEDNPFDVYAASVTAPAAGSYRFVYRFSLDEGVSWTYCDANEGDYGAGSFPGFTFELADLPVLEVTE